MPRFHAKKAREARQKLGVDFEQYLKLPVSERHGAAELTTGMEDGMRGLGIKESEIATQLFLVALVVSDPFLAAPTRFHPRSLRMPVPLLPIRANANAYKLAFWSRSLSAGLPTTTTTARPMNHILNHSHHMEAVFLELTTDPRTSREVLTDTFIGTKKLRAGARLLVPHRQLHLDPRIFSDAAASLDPDRFRRRQQQATLARSPGFRPFGGGVAFCPGALLGEARGLDFRGDVDVAV
ncbi:MAG: hypothetical protein LQ341_005942 [Variospora aurantia]|nr:MAG: hypothetical protein LQ341_005942 [Variospora aurantia]